MAGLFEGSAPDPVELKKSSAAQAPEYLTNYLSSLAAAGAGALGTVKLPTETSPLSVTPYSGEQLIAKMPDFYKTLMTPEAGAKLPQLSDLTYYQKPMDEALKAGIASSGVESADISKFYDPFKDQALAELEKQSSKNLMRNVLPALKALGVSGGAGGPGSSRTADISGQVLADYASGLEGQKLTALQNMYKQAIDAAIKEQGQQASAASALSALGAQEQTAATSGIKQLADIGTSRLAYDQSQIDAPLKRALNVAEIMRGYTYPTTSQETAESLPTVIGSSPLSQIAGLGTLLASGTQSDSGWLNKIINSIGSSGTYTPSASDNLLSDLADFGG